MRGHEPILAMRKRGKRPAIVFLNDFACPKEMDWAEYGEHATVDVHADQPEQIDLRFLIGMRVSISAEDEGRARRFVQACKDAGAVLIGVCVVQRIGGRFESTWSDVWHKEMETVHG